MSVAVSARCRLVVATGVAVAVLASAAPCAAQCTQEDLESRNAEKCAKKYAAALLKCVKKGTPLASCDVAKSAAYCGALSAGCTPKAEMDATIGAVHGDQPGDDKCRRGLAKQAMKLAVKRYVRARQGNKAALVGDSVKCVATAANECAVIPALGGPCSEAASPTEAALCVCEAARCSDLPASDLDSTAGAFWSNTLTHARDLGFTETEAVRSCEGVDGAGLLLALVATPTASAASDRLVLLALDASEVTVLMRLEDDASVTLFNEGGGVQLSPEGKSRIVVTDSEGTPISGVRSLAAASSECGDYFAFIGCKAGKALSGATQGACAVAAAAAVAQCEVLLAAGLPGVAGFVLCTATLASPICGPALVDLVEEARLGNPECDAFDTTGAACSVPCAINSACSFGRCNPGVPADEGNVCRSGYPRCLGGPAGFVDDRSCAEGSCRRRVIPCDENGGCTGAAGEAHCYEGTTTTTTSTTSTTSTTVPLCQSDADCNASGTSAGNDPDDDCLWNLCRPLDDDADMRGCIADVETPGSAHCSTGIPCMTAYQCASGALRGQCIPLYGDSSLCGSFDHSDPDCDRTACVGYLSDNDGPWGCLPEATEAYCSPCETSCPDGLVPGCTGDNGTSHCVCFGHCP